MPHLMIVCEDGGEIKQAQKSDPRITHFGVNTTTTTTTTNKGECS